MFKRIVFWQHFVIFHQASFIRHLAEDPQIDEVVWVVDEDMPADRKSQGFPMPDVGQTKIVIAPNDAQMKALIDERPDETAHILFGFRGFPNVERAIRQCLSRQGLHLFVNIEARDDRGLQGRLRLLRFSLDRIKYKKKLHAILCMGYQGPHGGRNWFLRCGYRDEQLFPFGHFAETPTYGRRVSEQTNKVRLMYLGQFIPRKAGQVLLAALGELKELNWCLTMMGSGESQKEWEELTSQLGITDRVNFRPNLPNTEATQEIGKHDLFILPSHFDGWGVVVNEALMQGTPVICSDRCGALDLLGEQWRGETFVTNDVVDLRRVLLHWIQKGPKTEEETKRIQQWSRCIEGEQAAKYFLEILRHFSEQKPRPIPPWFERFTE